MEISIPKNISFLTDELTEFIKKEEKPKALIENFTSRIGDALLLGLKEKEIFFFGLFQFLSVMVGYVLWLQVLNWVPQEFWDSIQSCRDGGGDDCGEGLVSILLSLWGAVIIPIVAFPVGILSCSIGTTHFLHSRKEESTFLKCLNASFSNAWPIWKFHAIDGFITVNQIIGRLPKENDHRTPAQIALQEAIYYAWKVGTAGMIPSLIIGNGLIDSGKNSVKFVKKKYYEIGSLRAAYSSLCWITGVLAYIGGILLSVGLEEQLSTSSGGLMIGAFYTFMIIPIGLASMIVIVILRPIYILAMCDLYSDFLEEENEHVELPNNLSKGKSAIITFFLMLIVAVFLVAFGDEIGITNLFKSIIPLD